MDDETKKQKKREYYLAHREEVLQKALKYKEAHREEVNTKARAYHASRRDKANQKRRAYGALHREELNAKQRAYNAAHKDILREKTKIYGKELRRREKVEVLRRYSSEVPTCACCGESIIEFLCIDHINGNGNAHRKEIGLSRGQKMYRWLKQNNYPTGFQVLCWNCNTAKGLYGQCPHQREK